VTDVTVFVAVKLQHRKNKYDSTSISYNWHVLY